MLERLAEGVEGEGAWCASEGVQQGCAPAIASAAISNEGLLLRLQDGCPEALAELMDRYTRLVHGIARRILRDEGEAEDITQEVFLEVYLLALTRKRSFLITCRPGLDGLA